MITVTQVENGKRIWLTIPGATVRAGMVTFNGSTTLAYPKGRSRPPALASELTANGKLWIVHSVEELPDIGMVKLGIAPAT